MFREMRRSDRQISFDESKDILKKSDYGVLSVMRDNGYPYGVPINYAYADGKLYFHSTSHKSHKLDAIKQNNKVCFTVTAKHDIMLDKLSTIYKSVIVFGTACILNEPSEKAAAISKMMSVFGHGTKCSTNYNCDERDNVMVEITPEHISGKARR